MADGAVLLECRLASLRVTLGAGERSKGKQDGAGGENYSEGHRFLLKGESARSRRVDWKIAPATAATALYTADARRSAAQ
jgi:hypothetical protein